RHRGRRADPPPGRPPDASPRPRALPRADLAPPPRDLRLHLRAVLRRAAPLARRPGAAGPPRAGPVRRERPLLPARRARREPKLERRGGDGRRRPRPVVARSGSGVDRSPRRPRAPGARRRPRRRALQRPDPPAPGPPPRNQDRNGRQVPRPGGAGGDLFDGHLVARGRPARHGVPLQPQPPERRHLPRALRLRPRREPAPARARVQDARADAARERALPLRGDGGLGRLIAWARAGKPDRPTRHSLRRTLAGSTRAARRAGTRLATRAVPTSRPATAA